MSQEIDHTGKEISIPFVITEVVKDGEIYEGQTINNKRGFIWWAKPKYSTSDKPVRLLVCTEGL